MFKSFFIGLSKASWAQRMISGWGLAWRAASRFVAGESPAEAVQAVRSLNGRKIQASMDHLGENTLNPQDAAQATVDILLMLDEIQKSGIQANVSIKLSQIGLKLNRELCQQNLESILKRAGEYENFVRMDMEDSQFVDDTLSLYDSMRQKGYDNLGVVIQSYLYRSDADLRRVLSQGGKIRLCKGAYQEPPSLAYPQKKDVDTNYDHLVDLLMDGALAAQDRGMALNRKIPPIPAIATHDPERIAHARSYAQKIGLGQHSFEFQMLYGIRRDLQDQLVDSGYRVRVYVPYGTHWYPYFMRRLAERPANAWFFVTNFFRG